MRGYKLRKKNVNKEMGANRWGEWFWFLALGTIV